MVTLIKLFMFISILVVVCYNKEIYLFFEKDEVDMMLQLRWGFKILYNVYEMNMKIQALENQLRIITCHNY